jgi:hypothetical protein
MKLLTEYKKEEIAGLASCLLLVTGDTAALKAFEVRLASLPIKEQESVLFELFRAMEQFKLGRSAEFIAAQVERKDIDPAVIESGISALLALKPDDGVRHWRKCLGENPTQGQLVRFGILLLMDADHVPPDTFKLIRNGDRLLDRMADAGAAIAAGEDAGDQLLALIELGHLRTAAWAMDRANKLQSTSASRLYVKLIDRIEGDEAGRGQRANLAIDAAGRLIEIDPQAMLDRIAVIPDDSLTQEAILVGLLNSRSAKAGEAGKLVKRLGSGRADSMALILIARHADKLSPDDLQQLGRIAAGGGKVDETLQILAAWLYLKHSGRSEQALTQLFATS